MKRILILAPVALLAACGEHPNVTFPTPPADKLVCDDEPGRPVGKGAEYTDPEGVKRRAVTDEEAGQYMKTLRNAGQSCRDDVLWLRDWIKGLTG